MTSNSLKVCERLDSASSSNKSFCCYHTFIYPSNLVQRKNNRTFDEENRTDDFNTSVNLLGEDKNLDGWDGAEEKGRWRRKDKNEVEKQHSDTSQGRV